MQFDLEHALELLGLAEDDLRAAQNMGDGSIFTEAIFGFHAQQAVEKALKAWMAKRHLSYPKTNWPYPKSHDIAILVGILVSAGEELSDLPRFEDLTIFAVEFRYAAPDQPIRLDRPAITRDVGKLIDRVRAILDAA